MIGQISRDEIRSAIEDKLCAHFSTTGETVGAAISRPFWPGPVSAGGYYPPLRRQKKLEPLRFRQAWRKLRYSPSFFLSPPKPLCGSGGGPIRAWAPLGRGPVSAGDLGRRTASRRGR